VTDRYTVLLTAPAKRPLGEILPPAVAAAAWELITGALADEPWRVGKPLREPYVGLHSARRGTYRILYKIDEGKHAIEIRSIQHRADAYRT
jgi:mRNA interferase RelE/StbE